MTPKSKNFIESLQFFTCSLASRRMRLAFCLASICAVMTLRSAMRLFFLSCSCASLIVRSFRRSNCTGICARAQQNSTSTSPPRQAPCVSYSADYVLRYPGARMLTPEIFAIDLHDHSTKTKTGDSLHDDDDAQDPRYETRLSK